MGTDSTPLSESFHIVLAGITNAGKSSLLNNIFQKDVAVVSDTSGTTTDPVTRKIELGALGACSVTDTAGLDDAGTLAQKRIEKTRERILTADLVLIVTPCNRELLPCERELCGFLIHKKIPFIVVLTFSDSVLEKVTHEKECFFAKYGVQTVRFCNTADNQSEMRSLLALIESHADDEKTELTPVQGLVKAGQTVILVTPIDSAAPKGRLILPQVETLRDLLDQDCNAIVVKENGLKRAIDALKNPPDLVITDSQAFKEVSAILPPGQLITSFSILFARKKGDMEYFEKSLYILDLFPKNGTVLIIEACNHHKKDDDIGTVKIPVILRKKFGDEIKIEWARQTPMDIKSQKPDLVIHCGACMITRKVMLERISEFKKENIPVINYGLFLAWANGLFPRAVEILKR